MINIDDYKKVEMKAGHVLSCEEIPGSDKLFRLSVDFGEESPRQIVSGIKQFFSSPSDVVGKKCVFVTNLEPRSIMGLESQGMILTVSGGEGDSQFFSLLEVKENTLPGSPVK